MHRLSLLLLLFLVGCAAPAAKPPVVMPQADAPFAFNGRAAIRHQAGKASVAMNWRHRDGMDEIALLAPLGQTVAKIHLDAQQATLEYSGQNYQAQDIEALLEQVLGWRLPLSGLRHWLFGNPAQGSPARIERDREGRARLLMQDGWNIRYPETEAALPQRMELQREGLELILVIDEWLTP